MKREEEKDEQLIRWLEGELSGEELTAFEASEAFEDYSKIVETAASISYPKMNEKAVFTEIKSKISTQKTSSKSTKIIPFKIWVPAVAAITIIVLAVVFLFPGNVNVVSDIGQFVSHTLPDGSEIELNANSQIDYKKNFEENRTLQLNGEAFFNVKEGKKFQVITENGTVSVLGTSFNVFVRDDVFVVSCKSGKVEVNTNNLSYILTKGNRVKIEGNTTGGKEEVDLDKIGAWMVGETYLSNASVKEIMSSLSSIYAVEIDLPAKYQNGRFTVSFVNNDFKKALKMVFSPMEIPYSIDDHGKVVISE
ncbi:MAG: FecR family protein [Bacteroidota bacterium]